MAIIGDMISGSRIIVIDDTPFYLKDLYRILRKTGYQIQIATTGELALFYIKTLPVDLILLDVRMPGLDGLSVCKQLKADQKTCDIPVIFINDLKNYQDKPLCYQAGAVDYLTKPYDPREVLTCIDAHLRILLLNKKLAEPNEQLTLRSRLIHQN